MSPSFVQRRAAGTARRTGKGLASIWSALLSVALLAVFLPSDAHAQAVISGRVVDEAGDPIEGVEILIQSLRVNTVTGADGTYQLFIPVARLNAEGETEVVLMARRIGLRVQDISITLLPSSNVVQNFTMEADPFLLEEVVVTGQGLQESRVRLGTTVNSVRAEDIQLSQETDVVSAMAGKAPNVEVTKSSGDPGAGTYIRIRGSNTLTGSAQPLFVVDGQPVINSTRTVESTVAGTAVANRMADLNPADIESVEILKGPAASAIYGSRASNGVVLITTKSGARNSTRITVSSSVGFDRVNRVPELQTGFRQGLDQAPVGGSGTSSSIVSWGEALDPGTTIYDHAREMFETGIRWDNTVSLAGGTDRTTYYLSLGYLNNDGTIKGNSQWERISGRLKGSHDFATNFTVGGNIGYSISQGDLVQQGSNISGMLLGAFRTPPEFNNCLPEAEAAFGKCWVDPETGFHRSFRNPNPTALVSSRGYDNPYWVANEILNTADADRVTGNFTVDYTPFSWLSLNWLAGADYSSDQRLTVFPKSSSDFPSGRVIRATLEDRAFDHSLLANIQHTFSDQAGIQITLGQNLNQTEFTRFQVNGQQLILGTDQLDFTIDRIPNEFKSKVRTEGYFAQVNLDLADQFYLSGGVRYDGSNTFGATATGEANTSRHWYPKASASWDFGRYIESFDFAKLRVAYGQAGKQPDIFSNITAFQTGTFTDGWLSPNGLFSIYGGGEGVFTQFTQGNSAIEPERTTEIEGGMDLAFLDNRVSLSGTAYWQKTKDAILELTVPIETGFGELNQNGAEWRNWGFEVTADLIPVRKPNFSWRLSAQWAKNNSHVDELLGTENAFLTGFTSGSSRVVEGEPFPILMGTDWVRFGRESQVGGVNIDEAFSGWSEGDLYIADDGFPIEDPQLRVTGNPNPDWTGSLRSTFTLFNRVRISGLLDVKEGGDIWNGTKGALFFFGTHGETARMHGSGLDTTFATCASCGPGAGSQVNLNWATWAVGGPGSGFTGPSSQFIEEGSYIKLRDLSLAFTLDGQWLNGIGFNTLDVTLSGRNLFTITDYTGLDPEANLNGQTTGRGLEYFNHPQTRTFVVAFTLQR